MYDFDVYAFRFKSTGPLKLLDDVTSNTNLFNWEQIDEIKPDIAFITNPTHLHLETAIKCLEHGITKLWIEKPIDCKTDGLQRLLDLVDANDATVYVAYPLRHIPELQKVKDSLASDIIYISCKSNLATWRKYQTYSSQAQMGGGAILELSHEIDLAEYLLGPIVNIRGKCGKVKDSATDAEDFCVIATEHKGGGYANIVLDIAWQEKEERYIVFNEGQERIDYQADDDTFRNQLKYFFDNLDNPKLDNNLKDASFLFRKIVNFRQREGIL
jgi:predicted dehydrogenase